MSDLLNLLIPILVLVESAGSPDAVGDEGRAVGVLQIHSVVIDDVNRILKKKVYTYEDRENPTKSQEICKIYLKYYGNKYKIRTGNQPTLEVLSRIWNGGPDGWKKEATLKHWLKVKKIIEDVR